MTYDVLIVGVGGQGVLLASRVIGEAAMREGHEVVMSEVHGMAQRGGSVSAVVRFGKGVLSPLVPKAGADLILGFEPVETYRALPYAKQGTVVVTDIGRIVPMTVTGGNERYPNVQELLSAMRRSGLRVISFDATKAAEEAGARVTVNSVLIGAISTLRGFPIREDTLKEALLSSVPSKAKQVNERAFELGKKAASL
ncbi:MAG: indolepyruvate ferredoxin oxidoreductase subunit beta [Methanomassiliicoccales archaeon]|jgi:indolepyruvate ferredoxin oxidoreductase beta subunit|nr:indolepyruvate ferredoxin oxidoreductase subunit beta [Methanomassiliicoccales archaeon]